MAWPCAAAAQEASAAASAPVAAAPATQPATIAPASAPASAPAGAAAATMGGEQDRVLATAEKRTADIMKALALTDPAKETKVRERLVAFYVDRINWGPHDDAMKDLQGRIKKATAAGPKAKEAGDKAAAAKAEAEVKALTADLAALEKALADMGASLMSDLAELLSPEQIVTVKDVMTYGRANIVYNKIVADNDLTDTQKAAVAKILADGRDAAWLAGSSEAKHNIMGKAVGRVNIYLDALKKVQAIQAAIAEGRLTEAEEALAKLEAGRDWLKEALGQTLVDLRKSLDGAKAAGSVAPAPLPASN